MARKIRHWNPDSFYHIVCRGNRRDPLFIDPGDYKTFLHVLQKVNDDTPFELATYCLMKNHFHLQMRSAHQPISKVMSLINKRYADYYNTKHKLSGHVFEKRYYDKIIEPGQGMLVVSRYIHMNPVEAGITMRAESYRWSSYRYYLHTSSHEGLNMEPILSYFRGDVWEIRRKYKVFMEEKDNDSKKESLSGVIN